MAGNNQNRIASPSSDGGVITRLGTWAKRPFTSDMDLVHWVLFTGLIIVASTLWIMAIRKLSAEV